MTVQNKPIRVLYSFPHKLGASRICSTAWHQVNGVAQAGAEVTVFTASICKPVSDTVHVQPTLARGRFRIPNRLFRGTSYFELHDHIVARRLERMKGQVDIVHAWPLGCLRTLRTAAKLGIPTVLERCNAHTRFAYTAVKEECERLGVTLPANHEHAYNTEVLQREELEYEEAFRLLCPSEFVVKTFLDQGFSREKLLRHIYGYDPKRFYPENAPRQLGQGLRMLSVGVNAVRKGVHFALEAWLRSPACESGTFLIVGEFLPDYQQRLATMLSHPSVKVLGHRDDVPELMRKSDILVLPSIEEGFGLVVAEAMGSGCVPLVSSACTEICQHLQNGLVHNVGDVATLTEHIALLDRERPLLDRLRAGAINSAPNFTWAAAGKRLVDVYNEARLSFHSTRRPAAVLVA
jgi:glycosyltransferase involved in cell wall biosynthesis